MMPLTVYSSVASSRLQVQVSIQPVVPGTITTPPPLIYKCDGSRFTEGSRQIEYTLKLVAGQEYAFSIHTSPTSQLQECKLLDAQQQELPLQPSQPVLPAETEEAHIKQSVVYSDLLGVGAEAAQPSSPGPEAQPSHKQQPTQPGNSGAGVWTWLCSLPTSGKGLRSTLSLRLKVPELGLIGLPLMVKVYNISDKARLNGSKLRHIQFSVLPDPQLDGHGRVVATSFFSLPG